MVRKGHVLLVEIDDPMRELMERWLDDAGYAVTAAVHESVHFLLPANTPRLVIVNVSNSRVARRLMPLLEKYAGAILIVSGRFRRRLGGSGKVLRKPFTRKELLAAVHKSLESAR